MSGELRSRDICLKKAEGACEKGYGMWKTQTTIFQE